MNEAHEKTRIRQLEDAAAHWERKYANARQYNRNLEERIAALEARCRELEASKDAAYLERNKLVALLATLYPSGLKRTAIEGWSEDWHGCVYIDFPWGQASWHYHDSQAHLFDGLPPYAGTWDGHSTEVKYNSIQYATRLRIGLQKTQKNPFAPRGRGMSTASETAVKP